MAQTIQVTAKNRNEALEKGQRLLNAPAENLTAEEAGDGEFTVGIQPSDASVKIDVSLDGMEATIGSYRPAVGDGGPLVGSALRDAVEKKGIVYGVDEDAITLVIKQAKKGLDPTGMVIARGQPPVEAQDGHVQSQGDIELPVFPGQVFGILAPRSMAQPGRDVRGKKVQPSAQRESRDLTVAGDETIEYNEMSRELKALTYGMVSTEKGVVAVRPLARVSSDAFKVLADIYATDFRGRPVKPTDFESVLTMLGVKARPEIENISRAQKQAAKSGEVVPNVVIAKGRMPVNGVDGRFELAVKTDLSAGLVTEDGRIDWSERGMVRSMEKGQIVGRLIPPINGKPGLNVYGEEAYAYNGRPMKIKAGPHVEVSDSGQEYRATIDGMIVHRPGFVDVSEEVEVGGDVNYSTGNINMDKGSVKVLGTVQQGFKVRASGNVVVRQSIEGAYIEAVGDVICQGGLVMQGEGLVKAGGSVMAMHATGANIEAGADVIIIHEMGNSSVSCGGRIIATRGKGKIMGGRYHSYGGVEANEIGSSMGVVSEIIIGEKMAMDPAYRRQKNELNATISKIDAVVGSGPEADILERAPEDKREAVRKLLAVRGDARAQIAELDRQAAEERARIRSQMMGSIKCRGTIHAGTVVTMYGKTMQVTRDLKYAKLWFNQKSDRIEVGQLG